MSFRLGAVRLRVHLLLPLLVVFAFLSEMGNQIIPNLLAFFLHECGHLLAAKLFSASISEIELTPLGGVITLDGMENHPAYQRFFVAFAGPLFSFLSCLLAAGFYQAQAVSFSFSNIFIHTSLLICLLNLLPVLPLDGGQMTRAILGKIFSFSAVTRILTGAAFIVGFLLSGVTVYFALQGHLLLSPAFAGLYLIYAANIENRQATASYVTALIARRQRLEQRDILPLEAFAAGEKMPVLSLLKHFSPGKYHIVFVLSQDGMDRKGVLEEKEICEAILNRKNRTLGEIIKNDPANR